MIRVDEILKYFRLKLKFQILLVILLSSSHYCIKPFTRHSYQEISVKARIEKKEQSLL